MDGAGRFFRATFMSGNEERRSASSSGPWREPPGEDLSRILALSDGIFAFAMTLLVVNLTGLSFLACGVPGLPDCSDSLLLQGLSTSWRYFLGYATVFLIVALYWTTHHRHFRYIERYDAELMWVNIFFLLAIAFQPFVLEVYNRYSDSALAIAIFASTSATTGLLLGAMWYHATGDGHLVDPRLDPRLITYYRRRGFIIPAIFIISIPIAFVLPNLAAYCWIAAFPATLLLRRYGFE